MILSFPRRLLAVAAMVLVVLGCSCSDDHWYNKTKTAKDEKAEKRRLLESQGLTPKQAKNAILVDEMRVNTEMGARPPPVVLEGEDLKRVVNE